MHKMAKQSAIKVFNDKKIRTLWNDDKEKWCFSIADAIGMHTDSENPNNYWKVLKSRLKK